MGIHMEIQAAINLLSQAIETGQRDRVVSMYTEDAYLLSGQHPVLKGHKEIAGYMDTMFAAGVTRAVFTTEKVEGLGDVALEVGSYQLFGEPDANSGCLASGHYMIVWKKQHTGDWLIHRDAFSILSQEST